MFLEKLKNDVEVCESFIKILRTIYFIISTHDPGVYVCV